ncbi:MAG: anthranilate synthase component I family protein [Chitinophagaceae bacterium]
MNTKSRTNCIFPVNEFAALKQKVLNWTQKFDTFCFLDNNQYQTEQHTVECMLAAGVRRQVNTIAGNALTSLQHFIDEKPAWIFGHLGYDLKNEIEKLSSAHPDGLQFPDLYFFEPEIILRFNEREMIIEAENPERVYAEINATSIKGSTGIKGVNIQNRVSKKEYLKLVNKLQQHILRGDCYEINFCQEFFSEHAELDPLFVYQKLCAISPNPFSALYKIKNKWLICASPERYLKKQGNNIISQPIKGTAKRITENEVIDNLSKVALINSAKDRSENVMVVDLVRNDLSKVCKEGTVVVEELFGVYSYPQVHQMISTISGELKTAISFQEIIRATFPMGSMTGAPKRRVMELIEMYEKTKRGIFSGALGYISPDGNFDFNVVIRSILYNAEIKYLSCQAGSGITFYSHPEKEWEECLMKAEALIKVLGN